MLVHFLSYLRERTKEASTQFLSTDSICVRRLIDIITMQLFETLPLRSDTYYQLMNTIKSKKA